MSSLHWDTLASDTLLDCRVFTVERITRSNRRRAGEFFVLNGRDWCNIIPLTDDGQVVMVEQFRHGIGAVTLEIPGGIVDADDASPTAAARREMLEECGYDAEHIDAIGSVHPNPAIQGNVCHSFVARAVCRMADPRPDDFEELRVRLVSLARIPALIRSGAISHSLVVTAFHFLFLRDGLPSPPVV